MTTWKGFYDRLEGFALNQLQMGDRRARTADTVLNIATAAGLVSLLPILRARAIVDSHF